MGEGQRLWERAGSEPQLLLLKLGSPKSNPSEYEPQIGSLLLFFISKTPFSQFVSVFIARECDGSYASLYNFKLCKYLWRLQPINFVQTLLIHAPYNVVV